MGTSPCLRLISGNLVIGLNIKVDPYFPKKKQINQPQSQPQLPLAQPTSHHQKTPCSISGMSKACWIREIRRVFLKLGITFLLTWPKNSSRHFYYTILHCSLYISSIVPYIFSLNQKACLPCNRQLQLMLSSVPGHNSEDKTYAYQILGAVITIMRGQVAF